MTIRAKLVRRLLILATVILVPSGGFAGFWIYRQAHIRQYYAHLRAEGFAAAQAGKNKEALDFLGGYLVRYPDDVDALVQYARLRPLVPLPRSQHIAQAINVLRYLLKLEPNRTQQRRELLDLYVQTGYWTEAIDTCKSLPENDVAVLSARTRAYAALRNYGTARTFAAEWSAAAPTDTEAQLTLLDLAHQTQDFEFTQFKYQKHAGKPPEVDLAEYLASRTQSALAGTGSSASTQPVDDPRPDMIRARALLLIGDQTHARTLLQAAAGGRLVNRTLAEVLVRELDQCGLPLDALSVLRRLEQQEHDPHVRFQLARRCWEMGDAKSVADLLSGLDGADPGADSELLALRADALTRLGRGAEAAAILKALSGRRDDPAAAAWVLVLKSGSSQAAADQQSIAHTCEQAIQTSGSPYLQFFLGHAYAVLLENDLALSSWQSAAQRAPTWASPLISLSLLQMDLGRYDLAAQSAKTAYIRAPSTAALLALARAFDLCLQNGVPVNREDVDKVQSGLEATQNQGEALCIHVDVLAGLSEKKKAAALIEEALNKQDKLSQQSLVRLAELSHRYDLGLEPACFSRCERDYGITPQLAYAKAVLSSDSKQAVATLESDRAKSSAPQSTEWAMVWARYLDAIGEPRAKQAVISLADAHTDDVHIQQFALQANSVRDDGAFMERAIERLKKLTGDQAVDWQLAKARWLLNSSDHHTGDELRTRSQEAVTLLENVMRLAPNLAEPHALMAKASSYLGRTEDALDQMKVATGLNPKSWALGVGLAQLYQARGNFDAAVQELTRVTPLIKEPAARGQASLLAAQIGDFPLALELVRDAGPAAFAGHDLLLAQMYWLGGDTKKAEDLCQKLLEKPDLPTVQFAAQLFASQGRLAEAEEVLSRLDSLSLKPGEKELVLSDFASRYLGRDAALKYLEQAASAAKGDAKVWKRLVSFYLEVGRPVEAAAAITRAVQQLPHDPDIQALKDNASLLTTSDRDVEMRAFAAAMALDPRPVMQDTLRVLMAARTASRSSDDLIPVVRTLIAKNGRFLPLRMYLVSLYEDAKTPEEAYAEAASAARDFPGAAEPQQAMVDILDKQATKGTRSWGEVVTAALKWRQRAVASPLIPDLEIAKAYLALGRPADAAKLLQPYIDRAQSAPQGYQAALPYYAQAQHDTTGADIATIMSPLLDQGAGGRAIWMLYATQVPSLEPAEAASWLQRAASHMPADSIEERGTLGQMWNLLATRDHRPQDAAQARAILKPLADKPDASFPIVRAMAFRADVDGDLDEAQACYRRALKMAPDDFLLKNNLAMVLARSGTDLASAAALIRDAIKSRPNIASLYDTQALVLGKLHHYKEAVQSANRANTLEPNNPQYLATLADSQLADGDFAAAGRSLGAIDLLRIDPNSLPPSLQQQIKKVRDALKERRQVSAQ